MKVVNRLVTFSVLSLMVFLTLLNTKAMALEEQATVYSPSLLSPPLSEEIPLEDIFFDQGEFRLREDAKPVLKDNAQILMENPDIHIVIEGYCNNIEYTPHSNLGQKRAESTKNYLRALGVESNRMSLMTRCSGDNDVQGLSGYLSVAGQLNSRVHFTPMEEEWDQGERMSRKLTEGNLTTGGTDGTLLTTVVFPNPIYCYFDADGRSVLKYIRPLCQVKPPSSRDVQNNEIGSLRNETRELLF